MRTVSSSKWDLRSPPVNIRTILVNAIIPLLSIHSVYSFRDVFCRWLAACRAWRTDRLLKQNRILNPGWIPQNQCEVCFSGATVANERASIRVFCCLFVDGGFALGVCRGEARQTPRLTHAGCGRQPVQRPNLASRCGSMIAPACIGSYRETRVRGKFVVLFQICVLLSLRRSFASFASFAVTLL